MKIRNIITILFFAFCITANAQRGGKERIKAYKTAYITEQLNLSAETAEKFWPIYNDYDKQLFNLKVQNSRNERRRIKELGGIENISNKDATEIVFNLLSDEKEASIVKEKMYTDLAKILSSKQLLNLYQAERNFNKRLLNEYKKRNPGN